MLTHPVPGAPLSLVTDASDSGVGAVLQQRVNGKDSPLAFYSHQLSTAESKYSACDRELLAIYLAVRHFRYFVEGRTFVIYTDHKPLSFAMSKVSDQWSSRQQRHLSFISEFSTDIHHLSGRDNEVADALSCSPICSVRDGINFQELSLIHI